MDITQGLSSSISAPLRSTSDLPHVAHAPLYMEGRKPASSLPLPMAAVLRFMPLDQIAMLSDAMLHEVVAQAVYLPPAGAAVAHVAAASAHAQQAALTYAGPISMSSPHSTAPETPQLVPLSDADVRSAILSALSGMAGAQAALSVSGPTTLAAPPVRTSPLPMVLQLRIASDGWHATVKRLRPRCGESAAAAPAAAGGASERPALSLRDRQGDSSLYATQHSLPGAKAEAIRRRPPLWAVARVLRALVSIAGIGDAQHRPILSPKTGGWDQDWEHELDLPEEIGKGKLESVLNLGLFALPSWGVPCNLTIGVRALSIFILPLYLGASFVTGLMPSIPASGTLHANTLYFRDIKGSLHPALRLELIPGPGFKAWLENQSELLSDFPPASPQPTIREPPLLQQGGPSSAADRPHGHHTEGVSLALGASLDASVSSAVGSPPAWVSPSAYNEVHTEVRTEVHTDYRSIECLAMASSSLLSEGSLRTATKAKGPKRSFSASSHTSRQGEGPEAEAEGSTAYFSAAKTAVAATAVVISSTPRPNSNPSPPVSVGWLSPSTWGMTPPPSASSVVQGGGRASGNASDQSTGFCLPRISTFPDIAQSGAGIAMPLPLPQPLTEGQLALLQMLETAPEEGGAGAGGGGGGGVGGKGGGSALKAFTMYGGEDRSTAGGPESEVLSGSTLPSIITNAYASGAGGGFGRTSGNSYSTGGPTSGRWTGGGGIMNSGFFPGSPVGPRSGGLHPTVGARHSPGAWIATRGGGKGGGGGGGGSFLAGVNVATGGQHLLPVSPVGALFSQQRKGGGGGGGGGGKVGSRGSSKPVAMLDPSTQCPVTRSTSPWTASRMESLSPPRTNVSSPFSGQGRQGHSPQTASSMMTPSFLVSEEQQMELCREFEAVVAGGGSSINSSRSRAQHLTTPVSRDADGQQQ